MLGLRLFGVPKGVPLPPLYIQGVGLQGRFPSRLRVGVLVGYNCISSCTRKIGSYPYTAGSFLQSCVASSPDEVRLYSRRPDPPCPGEYALGLLMGILG